MTHEPSVVIDDAKLDRAGAMRGDTVHFDIIDRDGNMVSSTPSGGWLQSSPVIPELGFCLGTRAQMFWLDEEHPAALAPGKRPRTTLTPSMALRDGEPYLAWGSPGGDQQDQWIAQFFLRHVARRHEPAGGDRRAGLALGAFRRRRSGRARRAPACWWSKAACREATIKELRAPRPRGRGRPRLVGRPADRRLARRQAPQAAANPRGMQGYAAGR